MGEGQLAGRRGRALASELSWFVKAVKESTSRMVLVALVIRLAVRRARCSALARSGRRSISIALFFAELLQRELSGISQYVQSNVGDHNTALGEPSGGERPDRDPFHPKQKVKCV